MIESVRRIGSMVLERGDLDLPIADPPDGAGREGKRLIELVIFDLDEGEVNCDFVEAGEANLKRYLWLGTIRGQKPQVFVTTSNIDYIINPDRKHKFVFNALYDLTQEVEGGVKGVGELRDLIEEIKDTFFKSKDPGWVKAFGKGGECDPKKFGSGKERVVLFTPVVKRAGSVIALAELEGYRNLIRYYLYERGESVEGRCHLCGREGRVFADPAFPEATLLKIYVVDKKGFFPGLSDSSESMASAFGICSDCKRELVMGLNYLERKFMMRLGAFSVYVIPSAAWINLDALDRLANIALGEYIGRSKPFTSLKDLEEWLKVLREALGGREYWLNVIFGRRTQSSFDALGIIQDVPTTRLIEVAERMGSLSSRVVNVAGLGRDVLSFGGLMDLWGVFPTPKDDVKPFVQLVSAIYRGERLCRRWVFERGTLLFRIVLFGYKNYNLRSDIGEAGLVEKMVKFCLLVRLLELLGVTSMPDGKSVDLDLPPLPDYIRAYLSALGYGPREEALFLLGVLMARVGAAQFKKGRSKPILEKMNYAGMSKERVMVLANQVFDAMRIYGLLGSENEIIHSNMKALLDSSLSELNDPVENVFYILSGYSFETARVIAQAGKEGGGPGPEKR